MIVRRWPRVVFSMWTPSLGVARPVAFLFIVCVFVFCFGSTLYPFFVHAVARDGREWIRVPCLLANVNALDVTGKDSAR